MPEDTGISTKSVESLPVFFTQEAAGGRRLGNQRGEGPAGLMRTGQRVPPDEVVETMWDLYNALTSDCAASARCEMPMNSRVVPEVPQCSVLEASAKN